MGRADRAGRCAVSRAGRVPLQPLAVLRQPAIGPHLAGHRSEIARIYSTSGTTGTPSYIPLTREDVEAWIVISSRSYAASGISAGESIVTTYGAGPFAAGAALEAFQALGLCTYR